MAGITETLAAHAAGLSPDDLPGEVPARAGEMVLDLWGSMLRARHEADSTPTLIGTIDDLGMGRGASRVVGEAGGRAPYAAALMNGALGHSLDFDDTHAAGSIHPGAAVIPAALGAAQMTGATGADVLAGIVAGYDITCRLSMALGPSAHYARGFHPSATCGVFGAAAAAGRVMGLDARAIASALGLCGSMAAGSLQFLENGAWNKRWQVGAAAANGLAAAIAARRGFVGAEAPIEGSRGFLHGYAPAPEPDLATEALGSRFDIMETAVKPYPACRYTHAAIDAIRELRARHGIDADAVRAIEIGLPQTGISITALPEDAKRRPRSVVDGQFSMHFVAAVAVRTGGLGWDDYARWLGDPAIDALCDRVTVVHDARAEAAYPAQMAGSAAIETAQGRLEAFVEMPSGEPGAFPDRAAHLAKFTALAGTTLPPEAAHRLADAILALPETSDWGALFDLSCPAETSARPRAAG